MSSESTITGRNGKVVVGATLVARITQWAINPTLAATSEWGDSDGAGWTNRAGGRRDATFTIEGKFDTDVTRNAFNLFAAGDIAIVTLWLDETALRYYDFPRALCMDFNLTTDPDTEEVTGWTASFGADGAMTYPGEAGAAVRVLP